MTLCVCSVLSYRYHVHDKLNFITQWNYFCLCPMLEVCTSQIICGKQYYQMGVTYSDVLRRFVCYDRFSSANKMSVKNIVNNVEAGMWKLIYWVQERPDAPENSLLICLMISVAWGVVNYDKSGKMFIYVVMNQHTVALSPKCFYKMLFSHCLGVWILSATVCCIYSSCIHHMYLFFNCPISWWYVL